LTHSFQSRSAVEEETKRRKQVEQQLVALQAEKQAALGAAAQLNDGNTKRSQELEVECAALRGELEALSMSKDTAEDERKRRKQVEQQLLALQAEKQAAMAAAAKLVEGNTKRSSEYEAECAKLRAELEAIGKEKNSTISQGKGSRTVTAIVVAVADAPAGSINCCAAAAT
jgi:Rad3-related DNA helicase